MAGSLKGSLKIFLEHSLVSAQGRCLLRGGVCLGKVSAQGRCLLRGGVYSEEVSA